MTGRDEVVKAGAESLFGRWDDTEWAHVDGEFAKGDAAAVVDAVTPLIAAQALRDAADRGWTVPSLAAWLREEADRLEREAGRG